MKVGYANIVRIVRILYNLYRAFLKRDIYKKI